MLDHKKVSWIIDIDFERLKKRTMWFSNERKKIIVGGLVRELNV